jgi:hypothetical protein
MNKPEALARRLSQLSAAKKNSNPVEISEIVEGAHCTAAYIAQMTGEVANLAELANLANGARFESLAHLLARAQLEAELWSRQTT